MLDGVIDVKLKYMSTLKVILPEASYFEEDDLLTFDMTIAHEIYWASGDLICFENAPFSYRCTVQKDEEGKKTWAITQTALIKIPEESSNDWSL